MPFSTALGLNGLGLVDFPKENSYGLRLQRGKQEKHREKCSSTGWKAKARIEGWGRLGRGWVGLWCGVMIVNGVWVWGIAAALPWGRAFSSWAAKEIMCSASEITEGSKYVGF